MQIAKIFWGLRALVNAPFFHKLAMPSYYGKPVYISGKRRISIGQRVRIYPGLRMEAIGKGSIDIGDRVSIGQNFHLISKDIRLTIGRDTTISGCVLITNTNHDYREIGKHILAQDTIVKETQIGANCFIGYGAVLQAGTILGEQCVVGANAVVQGVFPPRCVIAGVPGRVIKRYDAAAKQWVNIRDADR